MRCVGIDCIRGSAGGSTQYINRLPLPYPDTDASRELIAIAKQLVAGRNATGNKDDAVGRLDELVGRAFMLSPALVEL